jgi:hypothetical protein
MCVMFFQSLIPMDQFNITGCTANIRNALCNMGFFKLKIFVGTKYGLCSVLKKYPGIVQKHGH